MIWERLLILVFAVGVAALAWAMLRMWQQIQLQRLAAVEPPSPLADVVADGPALLYFTTQDCAQCRFQQTPILKRLEANAPIRVVTLDAIQRDDLTRHFGILTVPSTVLLDGRRRPVAINHGVAPLHKLHEQVAGLLAA